jgi:competence protein ComEC
VQDGVRFELLGPPADGEGAVEGGSGREAAGRQTTGRQRTDRNNRSCVLRVQGAQGTALLTGDLDARHEAELLAAHPDLRADWLLAPHHGSAHSSSPRFLQAVSPQWVVVQAGHRNRYGHPAPAVLDRYQAVGARWVASPTCGAATWSSLQPERLQCHRSDPPRYWWP